MEVIVVPETDLIALDVIPVIISISSTVAPLINSSSVADLISNKLPKFNPVDLGTITKLTISGDS